MVTYTNIAKDDDTRYQNAHNVIYETASKSKYPEIWLLFYDDIFLKVVPSMRIRALF